MNKEIKILLVEDNEGDIILTLEAMKKAEITSTVDVVKDGEEAMQYLRKEGRFKNAQSPNLILLDINLPRLDGKEVLAEIKKDPRLRIIPVVMLTTSDAATDILESYNNYANCYITKPVTFNNFSGVIQTIKNYWISVVQLPNIQTT